MATNEPPRPTGAELAILRVLWQKGPSTVREVCNELNQEKPTGYTTVLKFLQIMTEKGLVVRDQSERTHVYKPKLSEQKTQRHLTKDLVERAFGGSAVELVAQALLSKKSSPNELAQLRKLIDKLERGGS
jgi:predicted transcriptional regulator